MPKSWPIVWTVSKKIEISQSQGLPCFGESLILITMGCVTHERCCATHHKLGKQFFSLTANKTSSYDGSTAKFLESAVLSKDMINSQKSKHPVHDA